MSENQPIWINWTRTLQHWGIHREIASLLEAAGSLSVMFAQLLYISQPLLSGVMSPHSVDAFARVLENPADRQEFVAVLREGTSGEPAA